MFIPHLAALWLAYDEARHNPEASITTVVRAASTANRLAMQRFTHSKDPIPLPWDLKDLLNEC